MKNRRFLLPAERDDMRAILAAELGRLGKDEDFMDKMDRMVATGVADVLVSNDNDEVVMLRMRDGLHVLHVVVTETGFLRAEPGRLH